MKLKKLFFVFFCINLITLLSLNVFGQGYKNSLEYYSQYALPKKLLKDYVQAESSSELSSLGLITNPGISKNDYLKTFSCIDCNITAIDEIYLQTLVHKNDQDRNYGIMVKRYNDENIMKDDLMHQIKLSDNSLYFKKGLELIIVFTNEEDDGVVEKQFELLKKHYLDFGVTEILNEQLKISEFSETDFSDTSYVRNIQVRTSEEKRIQYLFGTDGGFIVFYNDGTVHLCGDCNLCVESIEQLKNTKLYSIYEVYNNKIMLHAPDVDISEPLILELHDNSEVKEWYITDFKKTIEIPSTCK